MDMLATKCLLELEADDPCVVNQWQMSSVQDPSVDILCFNPFSSERYSTYASLSGDYVPKPSQNGLAKPVTDNVTMCNSLSSCTTGQKTNQKAPSSSSATIISFGDWNSPLSSTNESYGKLNSTIKEEVDMASVGKLNFSAPIYPSSMEELYGSLEYGEAHKRGGPRTPFQAQYHLLAERKRRERLSERFIALSTIIPGLKKLDKGSILEGAIKYLKQLQERIKILEAEKRKKCEGSIVSAKRPRHCSSDDAFSTHENFENSLDRSSLYIDIRTSDRNLLLSVCCEKRKGIIEQVYCELEKYDISIISSSISTFGNTTLQISIIAQMDNESYMKADDLANDIRQAILKFV